MNQTDTWKPVVLEPNFVKIREISPYNYEGTYGTFKQMQKHNYSFFIKTILPSPMTFVIYYFLYLHISSSL